ncbi:MAG: CvpA family protein [Kiloniellales bacterium]|nr:CvpA family protein [Kiloniellales bacterium]
MADLPVNPVDIVVGIIFLLSTLIAFLRGFVHETLSIISWIGATFATLYGFPHLQPIARDYIPVELLADVAAGVTIFVVTLVILSIVSRILSGFVQESSLGALDRSLGLIFGLLRGFVIASLIWFGLARIIPEDSPPEWLEGARTVPALEWGSNILVGLVPEELLGEGEDAADQTLEQLRQLQETQESFERLQSSISKGSESSSQRGYKNEDRQELDSLIDSVGDKSTTTE